MSVSEAPLDHREPWLGEDGIARVVVGRQHRSTEQVKGTIHNAKALATHEPLRWIIDARTMTSIDPDAWVVFTDEIASMISRLAILVSESTPSVVHAFEASINKLLVPCQTFSDEESAVAWLGSLD